MWSAFPTSDYYETSATSIRLQRTLLLPSPHPSGYGRLIDASHVHRVPLVGVVPSCAPAASPHAHRSPACGPDGSISKRATRWDANSRTSHALLRPRSTRFRAVDASRSVCHWFTCVTPSYLACPATASGRAAVPVRCQGCSRPPRQLPRRTALSFSQPLRRPGVGLVYPRGNTAPRGALENTSITNATYTNPLQVLT